MTLEEAIRNADDIVKRKLAEADERRKRLDSFPNNNDQYHYEDCIACADEYKQLADWLRELKAYRSKWISVDTLVADLDKGLWGKDWDKVLTEAIIREAPSIEIVHCKDCKHRSYCFSEIAMTNKHQTTTLYQDIDFCSYGERSE